MFIEPIEEQQNKAGTKSRTRNDGSKKRITEILSANWTQTNKAKQTKVENSSEAKTKTSGLGGFLCFKCQFFSEKVKSKQKTHKHIQQEENGQ